VLRTAERYQQAKPTRTAKPLIDGMTRNESCLHYHKKVVLIARQLADRLPPGASLLAEDLASCGAIGLLEAFDRYDETRGIRFSTFAEYRIRGAMLDALRTTDPFPRRRRQLARRVAQATETLRKALGREPESQQVADLLGVSLEEYHQAVDRVKPISHVPIDAPVGDDAESRTLVEQIAGSSRDDPSIRLDMAEIRSQLKVAIGSLPEKQRHCVMMYYGKNMNLAEIAAVYDVTPSRISQILSVARKGLQKKLAPHIDFADIPQEFDI
jgi:RNA polymerase sigma factor FliA